jgi:hypothetical protein
MEEVTKAKDIPNGEDEKFADLAKRVVQEIEKL